MQPTDEQPAASVPVWWRHGRLRWLAYSWAFDHGLMQDRLDARMTAATIRVPLRVTCDQGHVWNTPFPASHVGSACPTCHRPLHHVERATA